MWEGIRLGFSPPPPHVFVIVCYAGKNSAEFNVLRVALKLLNLLQNTKL